MASTIKIKRSANATAPTFDAASGTGKVAAGELAWVHGTAGAGSLYVGSATGSAVEVIGGKPGSAYCASIFADTPLTGTTTIAALTGGAGAFDLTASTATAATQTTGDSSTKLATTAFVATAVANAAPDMNAISDTSLSDPTDCPQASFLIWDTDSNKWEDQRISGDVSVDKDGTSSITSIPNGMVQMGTDTDGNFVSAVTAVTSETSVNITPGVGNAGDSVAVGLATNIVTQGDLTVGGDLIVSGNSTQVNTNTIELEDPMLVLGDGSTSTTGDRGIEVRYNNSGAQTGFFGLDSTDQSFRFYKTAVINSTTNIVDSANAGSVLGNAFFGEIDGTTIDASVGLVAPLATVTSVVATNLTGELQTAAQPNVTEIGTITAGAWNADKIEQAYGGTGRTATTNNDLLIGNSGGPMTVLAMGSADKFLHVNAAGNALEYTDTMDGGSF
jgi:hypothetical protein